MTIMSEADTCREARLAWLRKHIRLLAEGETMARTVADNASKLRYEFERELLALVKEKRQ